MNKPLVIFDTPTSLTSVAKTATEKYKEYCKNKTSENLYNLLFAVEALADFFDRKDSYASRTLSQLSKREKANLAVAVGVQPNTIEHWIRNGFVPSIRVIKVAEYLGVAPRELLSSKIKAIYEEEKKQ